jgi:hypothetical protein
MDDDEQGFTGFESSDDDGEVVDMDELLKKKKKKPRVNIKSENVIILD